MKKLLIILLPILVLGGIAAGIYFLYFTPQPIAQRIADKTMHAASENNQDNISTTTTEEVTERFVSASSQRNFRSTGTASVDDTFYFSYEFTDDQSPKKARIGIKNKEIIALSVGNNLGTVPKEDGEETAMTTEKPNLCLTKEDLRYLDSTRPYAQNFRAATMIFAPNGLEYSGEENGNILLDRIGNFYKRSHKKDYQITLRGYAPDPELYTKEYKVQIDQSNNRANKILEALVKRDIARDRITITTPRVYSQAPPNEQDNWVDIDIASRCQE